MARTAAKHPIATLVLAALLAAALAWSGCGGGGGGGVTGVAGGGGGGGVVPNPAPSDDLYVTLEGDLPREVADKIDTGASAAPGRAGAPDRQGALPYAFAVSDLAGNLLPTVRSTISPVDASTSKYSVTFKAPDTPVAPVVSVVAPAYGATILACCPGTLPSKTDLALGSGAGNVVIPGAAAGGADALFLNKEGSGGITIAPPAGASSGAITVTSASGATATIPAGGSFTVSSGAEPATVVNRGDGTVTVTAGAVSQTVAPTAIEPMRIVIADHAASIGMTGLSPILLDGLPMQQTLDKPGVTLAQAESGGPLSLSVGNFALLVDPSVRTQLKEGVSVTVATSSSGDRIVIGDSTSIIIEDSETVTAEQLQALLAIRQGVIEAPLLSEAQKRDLLGNPVVGAPPDVSDLARTVVKAMDFVVSSAPADTGLIVPSTVTLLGTTLDANTPASVISGLATLTTAGAATDSAPPVVLSAVLSPKAPRPGERVQLALRFDKALSGAPTVAILGRAARVTLDQGVYTAALTIAETDRGEVGFAATRILGANGVPGADATRATDGIPCVIMPPAVPTTPPPATPLFTPPAGAFTGTVTVSLATATAGATIRYMLDGSTPTATTGTVYAAPFTVAASATVSAVAVSGALASPVALAAYVVAPPPERVATPTLAPAGGTYNATVSVSFSCATPGAAIRYATDGALPTASTGRAYTGPFEIAGSTTLVAVASKPGMTESYPARAVYDVNPALARVAPVTATPPAGTYDGAQAVTLACATAGATIRYTLDGTDPGAASAFVYSAPVAVTRSLTLRALAAKPGMLASESAVLPYTLRTVPPSTPASLAELPPIVNGTARNVDFAILVSAPLGGSVTAQVAGASALAGGAGSVTALGASTLLPISLAKLAEGVTSEIMISATDAAGVAVPNTLTIRVRRDTVAPRAVALTIASNNPLSASSAALGDKVTITLAADEPLAEVTAAILGRPVKAERSATDPRNWTVSRYIDGTEAPGEMDFTLRFVDAAGNATTKTKADLTDGRPLAVGAVADLSAARLLRRSGTLGLALSALPSNVEFSIDATSASGGGSWRAGSGVETDLSAVADKFVIVRDRATPTRLRCLGKILAAPANGTAGGAANGFAVDALTGALFHTALKDGATDLDESKFRLLAYRGAGAAALAPLSSDPAGYALAATAAGETKRVAMAPTDFAALRPTDLVAVAFFSDGGTPADPSDDICFHVSSAIHPGAAPVNDASGAARSVRLDGDTLVFGNSGGGVTGFAPVAGFGTGSVPSAQVRGTPIPAAATASLALGAQAVAGATVRASLADAKGNVSHPRSILILGAPAVAGLSAGNFNADRSFTVAGGAAGATLQHSTDGGATWSAYPGAAVALSAEGAYTVVARQTDAAGNVSLASAPVAVTIDKTEPAVALADDKGATVAFKQGAVVTLTATFTDAGVIDETAAPKLTIGSLVTSAAMTRVSNLVWTYAWTVPSGDAANVAVTLTARDRAGNASAAPTGGKAYAVDNTAPAAPTVSGINPGSFNATQTFTLSGEAGATLEYSTTGGAPWSAYTAGVPLSAEGAYTVVARQTDAAGNVSPASASVAFTIDTTAPTVASVAPAENATGVAKSTTVTLNFGEPMKTTTLSGAFTLATGGNPVAGSLVAAGDGRSAVFTPGAALTAGAAYTATLSTAATDPAGNALAQAKTWTFTVAAQASGLAVNPNVGFAAIGKSSRLQAIATYAAAPSLDVSAQAIWSSSAESVATVSGGLVQGVSAGTATITATYDGFTATSTFVVGAAGYAPEIAASAFEDISATGTALFDNASSIDDQFATVNLPFTFSFYGNAYTTCYPTTNGLITFGAGTSSYSNSDIPSAAAPNDFIAPWFRDLWINASLSQVYYEVKGSAPNRRLIVQWQNLTEFNLKAADKLVTFQAVLHEGSNDIVMSYKDTVMGDPLYDYAKNATVGLENAAGSAGTKYSYAQPVLYDGLTIRFGYQQQ